MNPKHQKFVDEYIQHGDGQRAYQAAYPKASATSADKESYRLLRIPTVIEAIKSAQDTIRAAAEQQAIEELKGTVKTRILTVSEKRDLLYRIATGEIEVETKKPVWDRAQAKYVMVTVMELPDYGARLRAIELDNRMAGDFAPDKVAPTNPDGSPLKPMDWDKVPVELLEKLLIATTPTDEHE